MNSATTKRSAQLLGICVIYLRGMERHGVTYAVDERRSDMVGAQCACCNTVIWANGRADGILNEPLPAGVPEFGADYRAYYQEKVQRFLASMPRCPKCQNHCFDRFVTNVQPPRLEDGTVWYADGSLASINAPDRDVWIIDDRAQ